MQPVRGLLGAALLGCCALAGFAQTALTPDEARNTAAGYLLGGHPQAAADITGVLIKRNAQDAPALILHAHANRTLRRYDTAQDAARRAWRATDRPVERYGAALAMAQALSSDGKKTRAQFWLRRAAQAAPDDRLKARAARDYQHLRRTNPWSVNLSFGITPGNNVNNAPRDNTLELGSLVFTDPSAIPVSGFEVQSDVTLKYTFNSSQKNRNFVALSWAEGHVVFTDDTVPEGVDASDFSYRKIDGQFGWDFVRGPNKPFQNVTLTVGRLWSAGDALADEVKLSYSQTYKQPRGRHFRWAGTLGYAQRKDSDIRSGVTGSLAADWARPLESGGRLIWNAGLTRTDTESAALTHTRLDAGIGYTFASPVLGARAQLAASGQLRAYDDPLYGPDARRDQTLAISGSLLFVDFDTYGFAPKLTLEARETRSNVSRFETRNFGLKIGFQSVF